MVLVPSRSRFHITEDFYLQISKEEIPGHIGLNKFGRAIVATEYQSLWTGSSSNLPLYPFPSVASQVTISSNNNNDSSTGTGARTVFLQGLNANYNLISETVTLNGQLPVTSVNSFLRINRAYVVTSGSNQTNLGIIYIGTGAVTNGEPASVQARIEEELGQTQMAVYTVPANKELFMYSLYFFVSGNRIGQAGLFKREFGGSWRIQFDNVLFQSPFNANFGFPLRFGARTDIDLRGRVDAQTGLVSGGFNAVEIEKL